jgi:hypothetical protein
MQGQGVETCNGVDDDCDGAVDQGNPGGGVACLVPGLKGECAKGLTRCAAGGIVCDQQYFGGSEACNGKDDDCDGLVDGNQRTCSNGCNTGWQTCEDGWWGACDAPPAECTSGLCCDGCRFLASDTLCDWQPDHTEYRCTAAGKCGGDVEYQEYYKFCTGASAGCGPGNLQPTGWMWLESCTPGEPCDPLQGKCGAACPTGCVNGACDVNPCPTGGCDLALLGTDAALYHADQVVVPVGGCSNGEGWHDGPAGSNVEWTWSSACTVPTVAAPGVYAGNSARWDLTIPHEGLFDVQVRVPLASQVCTVDAVAPANRYANAVYYGLVRAGEAGLVSTAQAPSMSKGGWLSPFGSLVHLGAGTHTLILYDHGDYSTGCFDAGATSTKWVFAGPVMVTWYF